jgi:hypothetical protein
MDRSFFSNVYGLVTSTDKTSENGGLFFAHYLVLKDILRIKLDPFDYYIFKNKTNLSRIEKGLFLRSAMHRQRIVSQDEISGMCISDFILGTELRIDIWNYLFFNFGNYNATGENKFYNLGSYYSWSVLANSKVSLLLFPIYFINFLISINKPKQNTSSKLIYFSELYCMKELSYFSEVMWNIYKKKMIKMYGEFWVNKLFKIYFNSEKSDYPLLEMSFNVGKLR